MGRRRISAIPNPGAAHVHAYPVRPCRTVFRHSEEPGRGRGGWGDEESRRHRFPSTVAMKQYYVYIMANRSKTLYVGVTNDLERRVYEHKHMLKEGFTRRYLIDRLVYYEVTDDVVSAIAREKQIKGWSRSKKFALIDAGNPKWRDLALDFADSRA